MPVIENLGERLNVAVWDKKSSVEKVNCESNKSYQISTEGYKFIILAQGNISFSIEGELTSHLHCTNVFTFIPEGVGVNIRSHVPSSFFVISITDIFLLYEWFYEENISKETEIIDKKTPCILPLNSILQSYLKGLTLAIDKGFNDDTYYQLKSTELLILLKFYYSKEQLNKLICLDWEGGDIFYIMARKKHSQYPTATEFANSLNYTLSGLNKRFRKELGVSVYQWMKQQKASSIYDELVHGTLNLKQLSDKYHFAGTQQLTAFCKKNFGLPPGVIRKKNGRGVLSK